MKSQWYYETYKCQIKLRDIYESVSILINIINKSVILNRLNLMDRIYEKLLI